MELAGRGRVEMEGSCSEEQVERDEVVLVVDGGGGGRESCWREIVVVVVDYSLEEGYPQIINQFLWQRPETGERKCLHGSLEGGSFTVYDFTN
ncbi:hypothetical protein TWF281_005649 [Arthrobotrys megalospora]